jgi:hypothetical protein
MAQKKLLTDCCQIRSTESRVENFAISPTRNNLIAEVIFDFTAVSYKLQTDVGRGAAFYINFNARKTP